MCTTFHHSRTALGRKPSSIYSHQQGCQWRLDWHALRWVIFRLGYTEVHEFNYYWQMQRNCWILCIAILTATSLCLSLLFIERFTVLLPVFLSLKLFIALLQYYEFRLFKAYSSHQSHNNSSHSQGPWWCIDSTPVTFSLYGEPNSTRKRTMVTTMHISLRFRQFNRKSIKCCNTVNIIPII